MRALLLYLSPVFSLMTEEVFQAYYDPNKNVDTTDTTTTTTTTATATTTTATTTAATNLATASSTSGPTSVHLQLFSSCPLPVTWHDVTTYYHKKSPFENNENTDNTKDEVEELPVEAGWHLLNQVRQKVNLALEAKRTDGSFTDNYQASLKLSFLSTPQGLCLYRFLHRFPSLTSVADFFQVSHVELSLKNDNKNNNDDNDNNDNEARKVEDENSSSWCSVEVLRLEGFSQCFRCRRYNVPLDDTLGEGDANVEGVTAKDLCVACELLVNSK